MSVKVVTSGPDTIKVSVETTPAIKVTAPEVSVISVNPNYTTGQPGAAGPQGPQGPAGNDGVTVTYTLSAQNGDNTDEEKVRITGSNGTSSEVVLEAGTNLSIARSGDKITFASTVTDAVLESDTSTSGFGFVVDDDAMNNASDTKVPTQQSVKAYVDNNVTSANVTTNITISRGTDTVTVQSSDGTDGIIEEATGSKAGVMTVAMHDKLDGIAANANVTDSTSVANAGAIMDTDFSSNGLMKRNGSGSYTVVTNTDGIDEGSSNLYYTETRFNTSLNASTALRDADFGSAGIMKTDGSGTYSVITPGTGLAFDGTTIDVSSNTTLSVDQNSNDVELKVTGPSGVQSSAITFDAGNNITLTETGNNTISIASTASGGASSLNDLSDVSITGSGANKYLVRDSTNSNYINQALDISHDTDPILGGSLDVATHPIITSSANRDIVLTPNGTGQIRLGTLPFQGDQQLSATQDNYVLTYDHAGGSGSKISLEPASGGVDTSGTPSDDQIAIFTDADTIEGQASLTFASNALTIKATSSQAGYGGRILFGVDNTDQYNGDIVNFGSGPNGVNGDIEKGKLYYLDSSQQWELADANAVATASGMLGIAVVDDSPLFLVRGFARHGSWAALGTGSPLYISAGATAGEITNSAPTGSADVVRVIGYSTNSGSREIFFNPSNDWIQLA